MNKITLVLVFLIIGLFSLGLFWLANSPIAPVPEKITETIDDAHIVH